MIISLKIFPSLISR